MVSEIERSQLTMAPSAA
jgi:hypothetical protein